MDTRQLPLATNPNTMSKIKAVVDFSGYTGPALAPVAKTICTQMTAKAATFPAPPVTMVAFQGLITTFDQKLAAKASRATADTIAFNLAGTTSKGRWPTSADTSTPWPRAMPRWSPPASTAAAAGTSWRRRS